MTAPIRQGCQSVALALLLLVKLANFAGADELAFKEHCAKCHLRADSIMRGFRGETTEERYNRLDKFLETHHAKDPELRVNIVNFLFGLSAQREPNAR
jgi:hypothetical protein